MSVDSAQNVTSEIWAQSVGQVSLPVRPGDVITGILCLDTNPVGTTRYIFANQTSLQMMSFVVPNVDPAATINAGVTRDGFNQPPLARFGVVYFDEISVYTTSGDSPSLTWGDAITMVDQHGSTLARPARLTDYTFKTGMQQPERPELGGRSPPSGEYGGSGT